MFLCVFILFQFVVMLVVQICNFCIIVYIDYGKLIFVDCMFQIIGVVLDCDMWVQYFDWMDIECECGIMIKSQVVRMLWEFDGQIVVLNMIDIFGYVDFIYEVLCFFVVCEGVILFVDVVQGIEVQMFVNFYFVFENDFYIILVLNKIDLLVVDLEKYVKELVLFIGGKLEDVLCVLGKIGVGVEDFFD